MFLKNKNPRQVSVEHLSNFSFFIRYTCSSCYQHFTGGGVGEKKENNLNLD